ncbi:(Fe-S)-binding protein [Beijerinckia indica]|uniref:4Fe-4S ferredoxin iron-sulfur binding domain protein n=1 Tax=Beijerinckia indica subsp. indica (strain ATCC 9039 / DSM 1715 / NCIMB 8712) TaxID=395963 RepID=B2IB31_BEII9|nr:(Fe-S)-binding protein [Beijerinckia indica]ACB93731.1 4Fe-4S ferredoxin iron-sulfur binding domain protein [Beijerinckia indica subsp. indica ATCC 9039]
MKTFLDWSAYDTYGIGDAYSGIPATGGNYAKAVAVCMHSRDCQNTGKGVMCPSYRITGDRAHSTEARVAAFKAALNGEYGDKSFDDPRLAESMDLCVSCKACKKECPSSVDMTLIKTEYLAQKHAILGVPKRAMLFGAIPRWAAHYRKLLRLGTILRNRSKTLAWLGERWFGIAAERALPVLAAKPFAGIETKDAGERGEVILFVDTFCHHFDPEIAEAATTVLESAGYKVRHAKPAASDAEPDRPLCCGRTYLTTGLVEEARAEGKRVLEAFRPEIAKGTPIIGLEPSCLLSLRDELYSLGLGAEVGDLGKNLYLLEEFLVREHQRGMRLSLKKLDMPKALVHGHCHQKAFGVMKATRKALSFIPGFTFDIVESSCCGMAGSFGLEAEHYKASLDMAEISLLPAVREASSDAPIIANGFSCRHQIQHGSGRNSMHIAVLLRDALA